MNIWTPKLSTVEPIKEINSLPSYGLTFFFRNLAGFKKIFWLVTAASVGSALTRFGAVYILSHIISNVNALTLERISIYFLFFITTITLKECMDYYLRRYGEAFSNMYCDHLTLRFYRTVLNLNFHRLFNLSKEKLQVLINRYVANVASFINDWFWGTTRKLASLVVVLVVLYVQSPSILSLALLYMVAFLFLSFRISKAFSKVAKAYSAQVIESSSVTNSLVMNLNTVKRLSALQFFYDKYRYFLAQSWERFDEVKTFHAKRWLLQLNLFNVLYAGTLFYGVYQVRGGTLALGYLVLIKYAFDQLWDILVYLIEYYVSLIQQREDTQIISREFKEALDDRAPSHFPVRLESTWNTIILRNIHLSYSSSATKGDSFQLRTPDLTVRRGEKVAVIGPNGSGKTSLLHLMLNLVPFTGEVLLDGRDLSSRQFEPDDVSYISSVEPLFNLSILENITLGRDISADRLNKICDGLGIKKFVSDLNAKFGDAQLNFSAGQLQRLRIARGLVQESELYLLDEPFNAIDADDKIAIIDFITDLLKEKTVLFVTHNPDELSMAERVYEIKDGCLRVLSARTNSLNLNTKNELILAEAAAATEAGAATKAGI